MQDVERKMLQVLRIYCQRSRDLIAILTNSTTNQPVELRAALLRQRAAFHNFLAIDRHFSRRDHEKLGEVDRSIIEEINTLGRDAKNLTTKISGLLRSQQTRYGDLVGDQLRNRRALASYKSGTGIAARFIKIC